MSKRDDALTEDAIAVTDVEHLWLAKCLAPMPLNDASQSDAAVITSEVISVSAFQDVADVLAETISRQGVVTFLLYPFQIYIENYLKWLIAEV